MQENIEQRCAIKFYVKLNKSATETFASLTQAYGDTTTSSTMVFKWHKAFKVGQEHVEDDPRSGRPISSTNDENTEVVRAVMVKDRRLSVRMNAEETGLDKCAFHRILTDHLNMRIICAKLVPKTCLWSKKRTGWKFVRICRKDSKLSQIFLDKVITGDESWVFDYDPETKRQSLEWHTKSSSRPKIGRMSRSKVKK